MANYYISTYDAEYGSYPRIELPSLASTSALGTITLTTENDVTLDSIASTSALGAITILPGAVTIDLASLPSTSALGAITLTQTERTIALASLPSTSALGDVTITVGAVSIELGSIGSTAALGNLVVTPINYIELASIPSTSALGAVTVTVGAVTISLPSLPSTSALGALTLKAIYYLTLPSIPSTSALGDIRIIRTSVLTYSIAVPLYRVVIADLNGNAIEEVPAKNLQYNFALNNPGGCGFVLPLTHPKSTASLLAPGEREIHVYRQGERVWGGYLWTVGVSSDGELRVASQGYLSRLARRIITDDFIKENMDQLEIAWDLINRTQTYANGALGITRFSSALSGVLRTVKVRSWERQVVLDLLQDLSALDDGFDFEISPNKEFKYYYQEQGEFKPNVVFELGKNIGNLSYDYDAENTISTMYGMGGGEDRNRCISTVSHAPTLAAMGLLEATEDFSGVRKYDTLTARTTEALRLVKGVRLTPQITVKGTDPAFGECKIGDTVPLKAKYGYIDIDRNFRVASQNIQVTDEGTESFQIYFNDVNEVAA